MEERAHGNEQEAVTDRPLSFGCESFGMIHLWGEEFRQCGYSKAICGAPWREGDKATGLDNHSLDPGDTMTVGSRGRDHLEE